VDRLHVKRIAIEDLVSYVYIVKVYMRKTECYPIQCEGLDLSFLHDSNIILSHFPCTYLGLPLHLKKPNK
jgi:hypothetical protein